MRPEEIPLTQRYPFTLEELYQRSELSIPLVLPGDIITSPKGTLVVTDIWRSVNFAEDINVKGKKLGSNDRHTVHLLDVTHERPYKEAHEAYWAGIVPFIDDTVRLNDTEELACIFGLYARPYMLRLDVEPASVRIRKDVLDSEIWEQARQVHADYGLRENWMDQLRRYHPHASEQTLEERFEEEWLTYQADKIGQGTGFSRRMKSLERECRRVNVTQVTFVERFAPNLIYNDDPLKH